jgi:hypothetical protein
MNKLLALFGTIVLIMLAGCKNPEQPSTIVDPVNPEAVIETMFNATMSGYSQARSKISSTAEQLSKLSDQYTFSQDFYVNDPYGGYIHMIGSITVTANFDKNGNYLGGSASLQYHEILNNFIFDINGQKYTVNGSPYVSIVGSFTFQPNGSFGTASDIVLSGGFQMSGPNYNQTIMMNITINYNSSGTGGDVSGTYGKETLNFTF